MRKLIPLLILLLSLGMLFSSCDDWVTEVDPLIDRVQDERLSSENQIEFVTTGVLQQWAFTLDNMLVGAELLGDAMFFDGNLPGATYPQFSEIDLGEIQLDNNTVDGFFFNLGEVRFYADDLLRRADEINFDDADLENYARYWGNVMGGLARYYYSVYFGRNLNEGGATIDAGPFIPSADMADLAVEKFEAALPYAADAYDARLVHSFIARTYLYQEEYANCATHAAQGLVSGDADFLALYNVDNDNYFWQQAGRGRTQGGVPYRFQDYIDADPAEAGRCMIEDVMGSDGVTVYKRQAEYTDRPDPIPAMTWMENNLMHAEMIVRGNATGDALALINEVRDYYGIAHAAAADLDLIIEERDKELFMQGARVVDQRRFDLWHLAADKWMYFPLTQSEINGNENL